MTFRERLRTPAMNRFIRFAAASLLLLSTGIAHASLVGKELTASYRFPGLESVYASGKFSPATFTVGGGSDTTGDIEGVTFLKVDFKPNRLTIVLETILGAPTWNAEAFNGPRFDLTQASDSLGITSASVSEASTMKGFDVTRVFFDADTIALDWRGLSYVDGTRVVVDFKFAEVPEPSTWLMLAGGLAVLGFGMRRRRA
jgi:hypothetical protein